MRPYDVPDIHQAKTVAGLPCLLHAAGEPLPSKALKPNRALKGAIAEWLSGLDMSYNDFDSVSGVSKCTAALNHNSVPALDMHNV